MDETFPEAQGSQETQPAITIERLPESLGFIETPELKALKDELIELVVENNWPRFHAVMSQYQKLGESIVERLEGDDFAKGQIGMMVAKGLIWRDGGRNDNFGAELYDAHKYARGMKFDDAVSVIEPAMIGAGWEPEKPSFINPDNQPEVPYRLPTEGLPSALVPHFETWKKPIKVEMSRNVLYVRGKVLEPDDGEEILGQALTYGKDKIMRGLEEYKEYMQDLNPGAEVGLSPFKVVHLGKSKRKVLTEFGEQLRDDVVYSHYGVKQELFPLWQAIKWCGFIPHVRIHMFGQMFGRPDYEIGLWATVPEPEEEVSEKGNA